MNVKIIIIYVIKDKRFNFQRMNNERWSKRLIKKKILSERRKCGTSHGSKKKDMEKALVNRGLQESD